MFDTKLNRDDAKRLLREAESKAKELLTFMNDESVILNVVNIDVCYDDELYVIHVSFDQNERDERIIEGVSILERNWDGSIGALLYTL